MLRLTTTSFGVLRWPWGWQLSVPSFSELTLPSFLPLGECWKPELLTQGWLPCTGSPKRERLGGKFISPVACAEYSFILNCPMVEGALIDHSLGNVNWRNTNSIFIKLENWGLVPHLPGVHLSTDE